MAQESLSLPYLALSGTLVLVLVISFLVFKPQVEEWRAARAEIAKLEEQVRERQNFLMTIDQKSAELRANAAFDQELAVTLPVEEAFDDVLRLIDRQAAAAGVQVTKVDNVTANAQTANRVARALGNATETPDKLTVHAATVGVKGSYQQIRTFLASLESAARFMDIGTIALGQVAGQPEQLEGSFGATFYSLSTQ